MVKHKKDRDLNWRPPKKGIESDESDGEIITSEKVIRELDFVSSQIPLATKRRRTNSEENKPIPNECEPPRKRMKVHVVAKQNKVTTVTVPLKDITNIAPTKDSKSVVDLTFSPHSKRSRNSFHKSNIVKKYEDDETLKDLPEEELKPPTPPRVDPLTPEFKLPISPPVRKARSDGTQKNYSFFGDIFKKFIPNPLDWFNQGYDEQLQNTVNQLNPGDSYVATTLPVAPADETLGESHHFAPDVLDEVYLYYKRFQIPFSELHLQQQVSSGAFGNGM